MKCPSCGNEFGNGANCQSCGMDKVTAFAKYDGYSPVGNNTSRQPVAARGGVSDNNSTITQSSMTVCPYCGEIIPVGSKFCPICAKSLLQQCPVCNQWYSTQYKVCPECGTNRANYLKAQAASEKIRKEEEEGEKLLTFTGQILEEVERQRSLEEKTESKGKIKLFIFCVFLVCLFVFNFYIAEWSVGIVRVTINLVLLLIVSLLLLRK